MFPKSFVEILPFLHVVLLSAPLTTADVPPFYNSKAYQDGAYGNYTLQTYITEPTFQVPVPNLIVPPRDGASPSEYIIWTPVGFGEGMNGNGPMILNATDMSLVYRAEEYGLYGSLPYRQETIGATVQTCNGTDYLTWWAGRGHYGKKEGRYYVSSTNYELVYNITAHGFDYADAHEFVLTPQCTALFTVYRERPYDLSIFNITDGWLLDSYFQEVDLATNELLFEWSASDHVNVTDTYLTPDISEQGKAEWDGMDYFHINSLEKDVHGNYLVSSRHMRSLYYIDGATGNIDWTLGGKRNQFTDLSDGKALNFAWQHHARWSSSDLTSLTLFDNRNSRYEYAEDSLSRGIILDLDYMTMSVKLAAEYRAPDNITSIREGSVQLLPDTNGNVLIGWGNEPAFTEYAADGTIIWDVRFGPLKLNRESADNYRALKVNWTGAPTWAPKIAAGPTNASLMFPLASASNATNVSAIKASTSNETAFFSWNGATDVGEWIILASSDDADLNTTACIMQTMSKAGFESSVFIGSSARYVRAVAVGKKNTILAATAVLDMQTGNLTDSAFDAAAFDEEINRVTENWSATVLDTIKGTWQAAHSGSHFWATVAAMFGVATALSVIGIVAWTRIAKRSQRDGYGRGARRYRSDTLDSKIGLTLKVLDDDEESMCGSDASSTFSGSDDEEEEDERKVASYWDPENAYRERRD